MAPKTLPVLMTASVSTRGMKGACFSDTERECMYIDTLRFYCTKLLKNNPDQKIVFVENSGWPKSRILEKIHGGGVEYIALNPSHFDISRGKGYNELILINEAIEQSDAVRDAGAFLKVTGRYPIYNLSYFIKTASIAIFKKGKVFYGDMKDHKLYERLHLGWSGHGGYAVLFASTIANYKASLGCRYDELDDSKGRLLENLMYDYMKPFRHVANSPVNCRFKREPICGGLQGSTMDAMSFSQDNRSIKSRIMRLVGNGIRILTPWFWF